MTFAERFEKYKKRISGMSENFSDMTEEATKAALIMPFFSMLGYDVFDPQEFVPEFICDVGTKKGEKIDYAIMNDGEPIILIEAKRAGMKLQKQQQGQLYRYFSVNRSRIAILTNGLQYNIYSDLNSPNVMDDEPFFTFNILNDDPGLFLQSLEQFCKENLDIASILSEAVYLKFFTVVEKTFRRDIEEPSDELVKYFLTRPEIFNGKRITSHIINKYRSVTAEALRKVMGVTINQSAPAENEPLPTIDDICKPEPKSTTNLPQEYSAVYNVIASVLGENSFTYSVNNRLHDLDCGSFYVRIPDHKPNRYVIFVKSPSKIIFIHNLEELKENISQLK